MRRDFRALRAGLIFLFVLASLASLMGACKREEAPPEKISGRAASTYSTDSVFLEVKKKLQENPNDADAWYHLADLYDRNGQYAEAVDAYKKVISLRPGSGYSYFKMGTAYDRMGRPSDAVDALKKATRAMPNYAVAYNNLGIAYGRLGKRNEEINVLERAIKLRPNYAAARYNLGVAYLRRGDGKAALRQYESLKDIESGAAEALMKEIRSGR